VSTKQTLSGIFDNFLNGRKIFVNRNVLRHDYVPSTLPHRQTQISRLGSILAPALGGSKVSNVFIYGKTGTGKTAVARFVISRLDVKAKEIEVPLRTCYVNCRLTGTNYRVLADICRSLGASVPFTGLAAAELLDRFREALNAKRQMLIVTLDEIDALIKSREENNLLYELTRINETFHGSWVGFVGISNDLHFKEFLDPRILSCLSEEEAVFTPYLADELYDILLERARSAFFENILSDSSLHLCAALAAREHGDARRALDLLRVAGELAERQGSTAVSEEHVRSAVRKIEYDRVSEALKSLPLHPKIVVIGTHLLGNHFPDGAITGDLYDIYRELCSKGDIEPLTQRRVSGLLNELDIMGVVNARIVNFGRYGRTKKIRLGVEGRAIAETFSQDSSVSHLLSHVPVSIRRKISH
jgi:cell division control protein 6